MLFGVELLRFSVAVDDLVLINCEVVAVRSLKIGFMNSSFGDV